MIKQGTDISIRVSATMSMHGCVYLKDVFEKLIKNERLHRYTQEANWNSLIFENPREARKLEFNILSGTSMACPHVFGATSHLK